MDDEQLAARSGPHAGDTDATSSGDGLMRRAPRVVIVGAGMSGLCQAILLDRAGFRDITIVEKADRPGGTWRDNHYPGLTCDVPSHLYQYSFDMNPSWSQVFSPGPEIQNY